MGSKARSARPSGRMASLYVPEAAARPDHAHRSHERQRHDVRNRTPASGDPPGWGDGRRVRRNNHVRVGDGRRSGRRRKQRRRHLPEERIGGLLGLRRPRHLVHRASAPHRSSIYRDGVQFALQPVADGFLVTDGHHNRVLRVSSERARSRSRIQFENIVPTGLAVRHGTVFLSQAGPIPHDPATGKVVSFPLNAARPPRSRCGVRFQPARRRRTGSRRGALRALAG